MLFTLQGYEPDANITQEALRLSKQVCDMGALAFLNQFLNCINTNSAYLQIHVSG